jgi:hypothetical protein
MGDCVCVRRGDGPEGCGVCNETGTTPDTAGLSERLRATGLQSGTGYTRLTYMTQRDPSRPAFFAPAAASNAFYVAQVLRARPDEPVTLNAHALSDVYALLGDICERLAKIEGDPQ